MDFTETLWASGTVRNSKRLECPVTIEVRYAKYAPAELEVNVRSHSSDWRQLRRVLDDRVGGLEVCGSDERGEVLRLENPHRKNSRGALAQIDCTGFTHGKESVLEFERGRYDVAVQIPYTGLLEVDRPEMPSYLGAIHSERKHEDGMKWESALGQVIAADYYHWEPSLGRNHALTRMKVCELRIEGQLSCRLDPPSLVKEVEEEIEESLWLLSFLSRKRLIWFEINATFRPETGPSTEWRTFLKRREMSADRTESIGPILDRSAVQAGAFEKMLNKFRQSDLRRWLLRAMIYCVASYHEPTLETQVSMIYLAVEALSARCGKRLLKERLTELLGEAEIRPDELWPPKVRLGRALGQLHKRRNDFIHEAKIEDPTLLDKDRARLQVIAERSILKRLGCEASWIDRFAYDTRWLTGKE